MFSPLNCSHFCGPQPHLEAEAPATLSPQQLMGIRKIGSLLHTFLVVSRRAAVPKDPQEQATVPPSPELKKHTYVLICMLL